MVNHVKNPDKDSSIQIKVNDDTQVYLNDELVNNVAIPFPVVQYIEKYHDSKDLSEVFFDATYDAPEMGSTYDNSPECWIANNSDTFAKAWMFGYTVEGK